MMRSASRQALAAVQEHQRSVVGDQASADTLTTLAEELYAVAGLLVAQPRLRRTLGDPATDPDGRAEFVGRLLQGKIGDQTLDVAREAVRQRWSTPFDLTDAIEGAGDDALFAAAEQGGELTRVEDELFRFERVLQADGELTGLLDEFTADPARRNELLGTLLEGKVSSVTLALLRHAVTSERKRSIVLAIDDLLEQAAARQERSVARVVSAVELTDAQTERLASALSDTYGRRISVRSAVDPSLRGGLVVRIGDEVIDGSIATRLAGARAMLAG
ncbi:F-type H+-transporting ATPase subunit delta [Jatrophihabitans endophyticus]|uniref:ATP synthase subunit delta n=1 Tax=Jatrophihabitans endophyticus TaxID=1206085 RepID=A0A1M5DJF1_9ACTN|nr:F0F1 ATP synthase subunit delta [Jatrophihabitans endophyticus]SHF67158.1 F-type H+-transporting ATPase subunit delta [Jatrophihabitans endophyticus]